MKWTYEQGRPLLLTLAAMPSWSMTTFITKCMFNMSRSCWYSASSENVSECGFPGTQDYLKGWVSDVISWWRMTTIEVEFWECHHRYSFDGGKPRGTHTPTVFLKPNLCFSQVCGFSGAIYRSLVTGPNCGKLSGEVLRSLTTWLLVSWTASLHCTERLSARSYASTPPHISRSLESKEPTGKNRSSKSKKSNLGVYGFGHIVFSTHLFSQNKFSPSPVCDFTIPCGHLFIQHSSRLLSFT